MPHLRGWSNLSSPNPPLPTPYLPAQALTHTHGSPSTPSANSPVPYPCLHESSPMYSQSLSIWPKSSTRLYHSTILCQLNSNSMLYPKKSKNMSYKDFIKDSLTTTVWSCGMTKELGRPTQDYKDLTKNTNTVSLSPTTKSATFSLTTL